MAKKTEPWPLLQDIVPAPRSPDTSKVLNFAAIVYKKGRESCFFARSCFLWIKPVGACFKTNWFCFSFQLETYIKPVGFASQNQLVWGWSWAKVRQFDACKGLHGLYVQIIAVFRSGIGVHQGGCLGLADSAKRLPQNWANNFQYRSAICSSEFCSETKLYATSPFCLSASESRA